MNNLLNTYFVRIFKSKYFYILAAVSFGFPLLSALLAGNEVSVSAAFSIGLVIMPVIIAVFVGLFVDPEFTHNTVRNAVITGHKRHSVYLGFFIPIITVTVIFTVLFSVSTLIMGTINDSLGEISGKAAAAVLLISVLLLITSSALSLFICMIIHGGKCLALVIMLQYALMFPGIMPEPSSKVLSLFLRAIPQAMYNSLDLCSMPDKPWLTVICTLVLCVGLNAFGIYCFKNTDLN